MLDYSHRFSLEIGEDGQAQNLLRDFLRDRQIALGGGWQVAIGWELAAQRIEVTAGVDAVGLEFVIQGIARHSISTSIHQDWEIAVVMLHVWDIVKDADAGNILKGFPIKGCNPLALGGLAIHILELEQSVSRAEFVNLAIGAGSDDCDLVGKSEIPEEVNPPFQGFIVGDQSPTFKGVEHLGRVEAEHGKITPVGHRYPVLFHAEDMGGIIEEFESVIIGDFLQLFMPARIAIDMHRHDGRGTRRDERLHFRGVQRKGVGFDVTKDRRAAIEMNRVGGRDEGERCGDDFARDPQGLHPQLQRNHPVGEKTHIFDAQVLRQRRFKLLVELAVIRQPLRLPDFLKIRNELFQWRERRRCDIDGLHWRRDSEDGGQRRVGQSTNSLRA